MKILYYRFFIFGVFLFGLMTVFSCGNDFENGKETPLTTTHDYTGDEDEDIGILDNVVESQGNADRRNWQKPREVIKSLGDLSDKVIADIGAGSGYFTFRMLPLAKKVIAIDIDKKALEEIDSLKHQYLDSELQDKLETRLVTADNPLLQNEEVDIVFISNTFAYIDNRMDYLKTVMEGLKPGGKICIVDFKMKRLPSVFPPADFRMPLFEVENVLEQAGFRLTLTDDQTLDFQYIVIAGKE